MVLDLSLSITDDDYVRIRRTLRRLIAEDATIGLAVFSDVPYELLPPGTPASELKPVLRLLVAPRLGPVRNPWTQTFRADAIKTSAGAQLSVDIVAGYFAPFTATAGAAWGHDGSGVVRDGGTAFLRLGYAF